MSLQAASLLGGAASGVTTEVVKSTAGEFAGHQVKKLQEGSWKQKLYVISAIAGGIVAASAYSSQNYGQVALGGALFLISFFAYRDNAASANLKALDILEAEYKANNEKREKLLGEREKQIERLEKLLKERDGQIKDLSSKLKATKKDFKTFTPQIGEHNKNLEQLVVRLQDANAELMRRLQEAQDREARIKQKVDKVLISLKKKSAETREEKANIKNLERALRSFNANEKLLAGQIQQMEDMAKQCENFTLAQKELASTQQNMEQTLQTFRQVLKETKQLLDNPAH